MITSKYLERRWDIYLSRATILGLLMPVLHDEKNRLLLPDLIKHICEYVACGGEPDGLYTGLKEDTPLTLSSPDDDDSTSEHKQDEADEVKEKTDRKRWFCIKRKPFADCVHDHVRLEISKEEPKFKRIKVDPEAVFTLQSLAEAHCANMFEYADKMAIPIGHRFTIMPKDLKNGATHRWNEDAR
jgi:histone H3/H4